MFGEEVQRFCLNDVKEGKLYRRIKSLTFADLHVCNILPFIHSDKPSVTSPTATEVYRLGCRFYIRKSSHLTSTTSLSFPTIEEMFCNRSIENLASGKRCEVTMTWPDVNRNHSWTRKYFRLCWPRLRAILWRSCH